jgi:uncharacterized protein YgiM (DUF1202 family)
MSVAKITVFAFCFAVALQAAPAPSKPATAKEAVKKEETFKPFTGKVIANKVRIRVKPDLDSHIFRQVGKNDLLLIVSEEGDFYAVQPPKDAKAYVFRSYVLDNVVEANRVNIRLEPHVDGPIIGQLQAGDKIKGQIAAMNNKWIEISPPSSTKFYVSKEFISNAGGPDYLVFMEKKKTQVDELLHNTFLSAETECKKGYEDMAPQPIIEQFQTIIRNFPDFSEVVTQAKEGLALLKDTYLQKKITYLEAKAQLSTVAKDELLARHKAESQELFADNRPPLNRDFFTKKTAKKEMTNEMQFWDRIEESLYLSWTAFHTGRKADDFYAEQKANATVLSGTLEVYDHPVKNRPGDWILRGEESPIAYLYSTVIDLQKHEGKHVTLLVSPRPNNHFAFPAYYVLSVE